MINGELVVDNFAGGISIAKKSPYCSDCGQKIDWEEVK